MEDIKTPKKFPIEREIEKLFKYLMTKPKTKLELEDKLGFYAMIGSMFIFFTVVIVRG